MFKKMIARIEPKINLLAILFIGFSIIFFAINNHAEPKVEIKKTKSNIIKKQNKGYILTNLAYPNGMDHLQGIDGSITEKPIAVRLERNGKPVPRKMITFSIVAAPTKLISNSKLLQSEVITKKSGIAETYLNISDGKGQYIIMAAYREKNKYADPIFINVRANPEFWYLASLIGLIGGLALLLLGMELTGQNQQKLAGDKMQTILSTLTKDRWRGVGLGIIITFILQSSSASTVMLVGLVGGTILTFTQAIGVLIGAKIGATLTVQIIAFNISMYAPAIIALGLLLSSITKKKKLLRIGRAITGFGFLFFGMGLMSNAMSPLHSKPVFTELLIAFGDAPLWAILFSLTLTVFIQSSSAIIGLSLVLASQNLLTLKACIPVIMGATIGTCATALIASVNSTRSGKQVALAHLIYSVLSMLVFLPLLDQLIHATKQISALLGHTSIVRQVANGYTLYFIGAAVIFLPITKLIERATVLFLPMRKSDFPFTTKYLQESSMDFPAVAIEEASRETLRMANLVRDQLISIKNLILQPSERHCYELAIEDDKIDTLERAIRPFLVETGRREMDEGLAARLRTIIYISDTLENIGDIISHSLLHALEKMGACNIKFSEEGSHELIGYLDDILNRFEKAKIAIRKPDHQLAKQLINEAEVKEWNARDMRESHLKRLYKGQIETVESSEGHLTVIDSLLSINRRITDIVSIVYEELPGKPKDLEEDINDNKT